MIKERLRNFPVLFWFGLTTFSVWIFSTRSVYSIDGAQLYFYGYPKPWFCWSQVSSLLYEINVPNLMLSLALYGLVLVVVISLALGFLSPISRSVQIVGRFLGFMTLAMAVICFLVHTSTKNFELTYPEPSWKFHSSEIYFSLERPYQPRDRIQLPKFNNLSRTKVR